MAKTKIIKSKDWINVYYVYLEENVLTLREELVLEKLASIYGIGIGVEGRVFVVSKTVGIDNVVDIGYRQSKSENYANFLETLLIINGGYPKSLEQKDFLDFSNPKIKHLFDEAIIKLRRAGLRAHDWGGNVITNNIAFSNDSEGVLSYSMDKNSIDFIHSLETRKMREAFVLY